VAVTAANTADREVIDELLDQPATGAPAADTGEDRFRGRLGFERF
jgi:hypothetical protein